jgi:hypothetical protein
MIPDPGAFLPMKAPLLPENNLPGLMVFKKVRDGPG